MITKWPGLEKENLIGPGDLAVTIDYRDVLGEILTHRLSLISEVIALIVTEIQNSTARLR